MRLFRVIVQVPEIDRAVTYYESLLGLTGRRVSSGRHYLDCGGVLVALFSPREDTDPFDARPSPGHLYFAVADLEAVHQRALGLGFDVDEMIETRPWGERSFYLQDLFGNPLCMVDETTLFTG